MAWLSSSGHRRRSRCDCRDGSLGMDVPGVAKSGPAGIQGRKRLVNRMQSRVRRAENRRVFVQDNRNRNVLQNGTERPFVRKRSAKRAFLKDWKNLHGDSAGEINTAVG